ncbi:sulfiredoxin [Metschnikowia bicuspidata var. bicuspidata NRRL YB-4993]|uniref:Sulfiredoxin n=1 Tax=Metschnikowia bicuspidata var. bicuspidata NRRL YB-4993 TaxID=869754 RepID=A0A1A0H7B1_9ASCO|nr:sulfiredoxin [Metschnikowia bicuspidata var. bicuspidata NRRL YB-4993]OBA19865.1 sulfiredoxin [Metschnikowia bicuspidata var. bicuspidata NRRL YB-4993]
MSLQSSSLKEELVPLSQIRRPIPPVLDYQKIDAMVSTLNGTPMESATCKIEDMTAGELPPTDVFLVREQGKSFYFAFGGCHRFQAYERLRSEDVDPLVKARILPATRKTLKVYLGSSVDEMFT